MLVSPLVWGLTLAVIIGLLLFDYFFHVRRAHEPSLKEAALWSGLYVGLAVLFGLFIWWQWDGVYAGEYLAGWLTEKSLSVDNLFVFLLLFASFGIPRKYQQKVLLFGITFALILRTVFIFAGAALLENFSWLFYLFGAVLVLTAVNMLRSKEEEEFKENIMLRMFRRVIPTTKDYVSDKMAIREKGKLFATPLLIAFIAIGTTDILFALDSIPAIFGLTQEAYLVFTANAFALLGLRQLFFLIDGLLRKLKHLSIGLSVILLFIGVKLFLEALHTNSLSFINNGHAFHVPEIPIWFSLGFIVITLTVTVITSLISSKHDQLPKIDPEPELLSK